MKTYKVILEERRYYTIEIQAEDRDKAVELAFDSEKFVMNEFDNDEMETDY